jgi:hypothetical protein
MNKKICLVILLSAAMLISPLAGIVLATNPYTDPTALAYDVDYSFSFMDVLRANHTYVPADKVTNPVQKVTISYDEKPLSCDIKVGGVTYSLGKDFTYTGHVDQTYYSPSFANPALGYLYPSSFSGSEGTVNYMYNFSAVPGGLEGTLSMLTTAKDGVGSIVSVGGTGDFRNVEVKASYITPRWYEAATGVVHMYHDGAVSGWPKAVPTFYTSNTIVTYDQLTDKCVNVWGLPSNPYPAFPTNVRSEYRIFNVVIGDKFYLGVSCSSSIKSVYDPVARTVALTYNATSYLGDWYKGVAKMDQGFNGKMVVTLLNFTPGNATATPPTSTTYEIGPALWNLQGFGALAGQSMMLRADGPVQPYMAKGYTTAAYVSGQWQSYNGVPTGGTPVTVNIVKAGSNALVTLHNYASYLPGGSITGLPGSIDQTIEITFYYNDSQVVESLPNGTLGNVNSILADLRTWPKTNWDWHVDRAFTGSVLGIAGSFAMTLDATGYGRIGSPDVLDGTWIITSGAGGLANLHGQGTWHSIGVQLNEYEGRVYFEP